MNKHEYLRAEDYYECNTVAAGRRDYTCNFCGNTIKKGEAQKVHKFYPEFDSYRTHVQCSDKFFNSLLTEEDILQREISEKRREKINTVLHSLN